MNATILTLNVGSSSVKCQLFAQEKDLSCLVKASISGLGTSPVLKIAGPGKAEARGIAPDSTHEDAIKKILDWIEEHSKTLSDWLERHTSEWEITAVAHRIVHGGQDFTEAARITPEICRALEKLNPLAPLHQPHNLAGVAIAQKLLPGAAQIACFDTAFHAKHDPLFTRYALPDSLTEKGVRRYGFHGLSYEWIAHVLREKHPELAKGRVLAAHLGNGASLCAMTNGQSTDSTMGLTALDGIPMGTRSGAIDPGAVLYMIRSLDLEPEEVEHILYEQSGLKGLSGDTNDVKALLKSNDPRAKFALDYYALKVAQFAAMMAVSAGGLDALVFTGGIGENAASMRDAVLKRLSFLGSFQNLVIPANEERAMAMQSLALLAPQGR